MHRLNDMKGLIWYYPDDPNTHPKTATTLSLNLNGLYCLRVGSPANNLDCEILDQPDFWYEQYFPMYFGDWLKRRRKEPFLTQE